MLQDDSKCEMIVGIDHFMTASAKYCDILLPDLMPTEQEDLISHESAGNMGYVILAQPATSAKFERKPIYWMLSEVAKRQDRTFIKPLLKVAVSMNGSNISMRKRRNVTLRCPTTRR